MDNNKKHKPLILAPAGNTASFFAAIAAGADAVYCGLKNFSARMEANNFSTEELSILTQFAHSKGVKVYITLNSILKPEDIQQAGNLLDKLKKYVKPDALIIADLAFIKLAKDVGFKGELHLSTLANMSQPEAISWSARNFGVKNIVVPRELNIDEIKKMAENCPDGIELETFVHGALCYGVSGRCYWSSFLGGKSGLRGRCVQPCRRMYTQKNQKKRYFSCQDLSLDVLAKVLLTIPEITTWKIEGRKKGPHYVYYAVKAYKMMRDHGTDPQMKRAAIGLLGQALGRTATHYNFLPQRPQNPVDTEKQTGSGLLLGTLKGTHKNQFFIPRQALMRGDLLRIGYEDAGGHAIQKVYKSVPKKGRLHVKFDNKRAPASGSPVFLIDRREKELLDIIETCEAELDKFTPAKVSASQFKLNFTGSKTKKRGKKLALETRVQRNPSRKIQKNDSLWLSEKTADLVPKKITSDCWWWLPPVIWPEDEQDFKKLVERILKKGAQNFVLNSPFQMTLFSNNNNLNIWAGPFCNQSNGFSISILAKSGFSGVIVSPELSKEDYMNLPAQSPVPLGIVLSGSWPLAVSRVLSDEIKPNVPFSSPKGETSWARKHGTDYWIFPDWITDITSKKEELIKAGYSFFIHMDETVPKEINLRKRPGKWNWDLKLL